MEAAGAGKRAGSREGSLPFSVVVASPLLSVLHSMIFPLLSAVGSPPGGFRSIPSWKTGNAVLGSKFLIPINNIYIGSKEPCIYS